MTKKILEENISCEKVIRSKNGNFKIRNGFFYKHGKTAESDKDIIVEQLKKQFPNNEFEVIHFEENWNTWPKDSYFETEIKFI